MSGRAEEAWRVGPPPHVLGAVALGLVVAVTVVHYTTGMHHVDFHNVYRRLYYVPIVLGGFAYGWRGGVGMALLACGFYVPHAFFMAHRDPAPFLDKVLELVLYLTVGVVTGWLVSRQRAVQRELEGALRAREALQVELTRAGKLSALGEMVQGVAHEVRNPLATIMGSAEALAADFPEGHRKRRMAELMLGEIERLNRVVSDLLSFSRPQPPQRAEVDLSQVVRHVLSLVTHHERAASATLRDEVTPGELIVWADPDQVTQVVLNLVMNALLASEEPAQIELIAREGRLGVRDHGPGIEPEHREQIFTPYFTTRREGSGLGLSISARIVEAHQGELSVEETPGGGATFWVKLPGAEERRTR